MANVRRLVMLVALLAALVCSAGSAAAEFSLDLYGGATWTPSQDLHVKGIDSTGRLVGVTIFDLEPSTGFSAGLRPGYWFDGAPTFGVDLDLWYMHIPINAQTRVGSGILSGDFLGRPITVTAAGVATIPSVTLPIFAFAPEIRLRWPLDVDPSFPFGRWQPFIGAGPAWAFSLDEKHVTLQLGGKVSAGVAYRITPWFALIGEYRYTFFPGFEFTNRNLTYKADLSTHTAAFGISF